MRTRGGELDWCVDLIWLSWDWSLLRSFLAWGLRLRMVAMEGVAVLSEMRVLRMSSMVSILKVLICQL